MALPSRAVDPGESLPSVSLYHDEIAERFRGHRVGDVINFTIKGRIESISKNGVSFEMLALTVGKNMLTFSQAAEMAEQEVRVITRTEQASG